MTTRTFGAAALAAACALAVACAGARTQGQAADGRAARPEHPAVDAGVEGCEGCHAQVTPAVAADWRRGKHGVALVGCFMCHGSTGGDFRAVPATTQCQSCHPQQAAALEGVAPREADRVRCFSCHPPHALHVDGGRSPHQVVHR